MNHEIFRITSVSVAGPYSLHLGFNDGTSKTVNLESALSGELYEPLRDPEVFRQVRLDPEVHTVVWPMVPTSIRLRRMTGMSLKRSGNLKPSGWTRLPRIAHLTGVRVNKDVPLCSVPGTGCHPPSP